MKKQGIWTIATLSVLRCGDKHEPRTWGYCFTKEEAIDAMQLRCDDEAGYYTHAVIEFFKPGIYSISDTQLWFRWNNKARHWKPCRKPVGEGSTFNYGMG